MDRVFVLTSDHHVSYFLFFLSHVNPFTGIIYQSVLLTHQPPVRSMSMEETVLPNTSPAQWPGNPRRLSER